MRKSIIAGFCFILLSGSIQSQTDTVNGPYNLHHPYAGVRRILIELSDDQLLAQKFAGQYCRMVAFIAGQLLNEEEMVPKEDDPDSVSMRKQRNFLNRIWSIYSTELDIQYGFNNFSHDLWKCLIPDDMLMDCDNSAFLVYDVGRKLGFNIELILVNGLSISHALVKTPDYEYESTDGAFYRLGYAKKTYQTFLHIINDPEKLQSIPEMNKSLTYSDLRVFDRAISSGLRAISLDPDNSLAQYCLGLVYKNAGQLEKARRQFSEAIRVSGGKYAAAERELEKIKLVAAIQH
ncbi:MAG: tetratricopeptide repeat protein [Bacteroidetes bacterium]|nr:tetratricopeptide repeat protein [Bacteroidota bacterium]